MSKECRSTNVQTVAACSQSWSCHWAFGFVSSLGIRHSSFISQRLHRINPCRSPGRDVAGDTRNGSEGQQDAKESPNVAGFDLIQQTLQVVGENQRSDYSQNHPAEHQPSAE